MMLPNGPPARPARGRGPPLPAHARCTPDDPAARRAMTDAPLFEVLGPNGRPPGPDDAALRFKEFIDAKRSLDRSASATGVRCTRCGALLATRAATRPDATDRFVRSWLARTEDAKPGSDDEDES